MHRHEKEARALMRSAWFCVLLEEGSFMRFPVVGVIAHFADLWCGDLYIELEMVSKLFLYLESGEDD